MPGRRAEPQFVHAPGLPHDPWNRRPFHRLTTVRSTSLILPAVADEVPLYLGRLAPYYDASASALPRRIGVSTFDVGSCNGKRCSELRDNLIKLTINIFQVPSGRIVYATTFDVTTPGEDLVPLLEDCYYETFELDLDGRTRRLSDLVAQEIDRYLPGRAWEPAPDLHQILFLSPQLSGLASDDQREVRLDDTLLRSLIYRVRVPQRDGFTSIQFPSELNRGLTAIAGVGSFVSVLCGHQDYVENAAVVSAAMIVSATNEMRDIQESILRSFAMVHEKLGTLSRIERQQALGEISEQLARHEMSLSQHVESTGEVGLWIPSLRVEEYHRTLARSVRLFERADIIGKSIARLTSIAAARTQVLIAEEQQLQEHRRRSWAIVVGLLTILAIPVSFVLAFFGVATPEVDPELSMFDLGRYLWVYAFAFGTVGLSALAVLVFWYAGHPGRRRNG